jgi:membrane protein YdbS with pleckstrin-like domain
MIESKSDKRLLKDRHERFRQIVGQRSQARPESSAEHECFDDHLLSPPTTLVLGLSSAKTFRMPEETIWHGTSSQWKNLGLYLLCGLFCWLIVPIFIALARYLQTKNKIYELTTERLKITEGVFNKVTDTLELYRVKDIETRQPFLYRMFHLENIAVNTSDASSPFILVEAIPSMVGFADKMRNQVEAVRMQKGVREIDIE